MPGHIYQSNPLWLCYIILVICLYLQQVTPLAAFTPATTAATTAATTTATTTSSTGNDRVDHQTLDQGTCVVYKYTGIVLLV